MRVSIITINYNNFNGLKRTIESVRTQSVFSEIEYVVVDGFSTDASRDILKEYADDISITISEPDNGIYDAMNKGVRAASGDFLLFLNSGDILCSDDVLAKVLPYLTGDLDILSGYTMRRMQNGKLVRELSGSPDYITLSSIIHAPLSHAGAFIRRQLLINRQYDETYRIASDWKFFLETSIFDNVRYRHINLDIAIFDNDGISSSPDNRDIHESERKRVLNELPNSILRDVNPLPEELILSMRSIPESRQLQKFITQVVKIIIKAYSWLRPNAIVKEPLEPINI